MWEVWFGAPGALERVQTFYVELDALRLAEAARSLIVGIGVNRELGPLVLTVERSTRGDEPGSYEQRTIRRWEWFDRDGWSRKGDSDVGE